MNCGYCGPVICLLFFLRTALAIPVDNGVEGEPEIECGSSSIAVNFNVRNNFEGHVYVKGLYNDAGCRNDEVGRQVAGISLPFDSCNVARTRSLNPRGVFVSTTVVISFHPQFVTKVDRAYRIQCFYMEADKTVSQEIDVSDLTTALETVVVPMPVCRYDILSGGPEGTPVRYALVGQQVYHKWTCESETTDTFCMLVHSCTIDDGNGDTVNILDDQGCALDRFLLNNLEYPEDLTAGQEAHVYKYADRDGLFYQCQISITIKEPNAECPRPQCAEPTGFGAISVGGLSRNGTAGGVAASPAAPAPSRIRKREASFGEDILDVRVELNALDVPEEMNELLKADPSAIPSSKDHLVSSIHPSFCVSSFSFALLLFATFICTVFILVLAFMNYRSHYSTKQALF